MISPRRELLAAGQCGPSRRRGSSMAECHAVEGAAVRRRGGRRIASVRVERVEHVEHVEHVERGERVEPSRTRRTSRQAGSGQHSGQRPG